MTNTEIIERIRSTMRLHSPRCSTILYGSQARGEARADSDIDLLILVDGDNLTIDEEQKIFMSLYDIELETGIIISPLVMLKKHWENRPFPTPFSLNIARDGIQL